MYKKNNFHIKIKPSYRYLAGEIKVGTLQSGLNLYEQRLQEGPILGCMHNERCHKTKNNTS